MIGDADVYWTALNPIGPCIVHIQKLKIGILLGKIQTCTYLGSLNENHSLLDCFMISNWRNVFYEGHRRKDRISA